MKVLKNIIVFVLECILMFAITAMIIINIVSNTILSKEYVLEKLEQENYYAKILELTESNFEKYIYQSGLDENVIKGLITEEQIKEDTLKIINNAYENSKETISTDEIKQKLLNNIEGSVGENQELKKDAVNTFVQTICTEYTDTILDTKYEENINKVYMKTIKYVEIIKKVAFYAIIVTAIFMLLVNMKTPLKFITYGSVSVCASGIFLLFINYFINSKISIKNISIFNETISKILINILQGILGLVSKYGIRCVLIGVLLIVISNFIFAKKKENKID